MQDNIFAMIYVCDNCNTWLWYLRGNSSLYDENRIIIKRKEMYFRLNTLQHNTFGIFTNVTLFIKSIICPSNYFINTNSTYYIYSVTHCRVSSNLKHSNLTLIWLIIYSLKAHDYSPYCRVIVLLVLHNHIRVVVRRSPNNSLDALSSGRVYVVVSIFLVLLEWSAEAKIIKASVRDETPV